MPNDGEDSPHLDDHVYTDDLELVRVDELGEVWIVADVELDPDQMQTLYGGGTMSITFDREVEAIHLSLSDEVESRPVKLRDQEKTGYE